MTAHLREGEYIGLDLHFNQNCFTIEALKRFDVGFDFKK
jgi:hypothetical protein